MPAVSRGATRIAGGTLATLGVALALAGSASAAPVVDGEFDVPGGVGSNNEIVQGPDGNMWVTQESGDGVVRISPAGVTTAFPTSNDAFGITVGPDNNLWVTTTIGVARIDPATGAELDTYDIGMADGRGITTGPDGNLWAVGSGNNVGDGELTRFNPADPENGETTTQLPGASPRGMDTGSDGLIWIADASGNILSATPVAAPVITPYAVGGGPQDVAAGPNGQVAYPNPLSNPQSVGRITSGGLPEVTPLENTDPFGAVFAPDGAYWIPRAGANDLLRLTPTGETSTLTGFAPSGGVGPRKVATGPDDTLWVTLDTPEKVARVTGVGPENGSLDTSIDQAPKKKIKTSKKKAKAKFKFSSPDPAATFECSLKRKGKPVKFKTCSSPKKYKLKPGKYKFQVRAVAGGVADPTPAKYGFKIVRKRA